MVKSSKCSNKLSYCVSLFKDAFLKFDIACKVFALMSSFFSFTIFNYTWHHPTDSILLYPFFNHKITNSYIVNEVRQGADLRKVDLSRAHDCSSDEIAIFSDHVRDVYSLCLKGCSLLDSTISLVGQRCRYLRELDLTGCSALTDASCEELGKTCKDTGRN